MAAGPLTNVPIRRRSSCFSGPLPAAMRKAPISISATWPPEGRLGSCLTSTRAVSESQASNHRSPLALRWISLVQTATAKFAPCSAPPYSGDGRSATSAVKGRRFKLRYYRNLLLPPARPSGSNADALPRVTPITLSPGPAEPANQPGLDGIAADPEHDRDGRGRRLRCDLQKARSGRYDSGHLLSHLLCPFLI